MKEFHGVPVDCPHLESGSSVSATQLDREHMTTVLLGEEEPLLGSSAFLSCLISSYKVQQSQMTTSFRKPGLCS